MAERAHFRRPLFLLLFEYSCLTYYRNCNYDSPPHFLPSLLFLLPTRPNDILNCLAKRASKSAGPGLHFFFRGAPRQALISNVVAQTKFKCWNAGVPAIYLPSQSAGKKYRCCSAGAPAQSPSRVAQASSLISFPRGAGVLACGNSCMGLRGEMEGCGARSLLGRGEAGEPFGKM